MRTSRFTVTCERNAVPRRWAYRLYRMCGSTRLSNLVKVFLWEGDQQMSAIALRSEEMGVYTEKVLG